MTDAQSANRQGVTPAKLVLIGVLALILCAVLYWNFFRKPVPGETSARRKTDVAVSAGEAVSKQGNVAVDSSAELDQLAQGAVQLRKRPWPAYSLAQVVAYDPFALPSAFPQPPAPAEGDNRVPRSPADDKANAAALRAQAEKARADAIAAIRAKGVQVVLKKANEYVAVIDGHEIRVGDAMEGFEVVQIDASGVWLEEGTVQ